MLIGGSNYTETVGGEDTTGLAKATPKPLSPECRRSVIVTIQSWTCDDDRHGLPTNMKDNHHSQRNASTLHYVITESMINIMLPAGQHQGNCGKYSSIIRKHHL